MKRLICLLFRHSWERADTFPDHDLDMTKINAEQWGCNQRWMVERCSRCGRVENWAFNWRSRSEHLEAPPVPAQSQEGEGK